jgi:EAL domain-containing protein (putative c-di-GMP-specific phosphodiesterase class I)
VSAVPSLPPEDIALRDATPLGAAVAERDADVMFMVEEAVRNRQVRLAFQPVVPCQDPDRPAFYECLSRVLDNKGRPIPAAEFIDQVEMHELGRKIDCLALEAGFRTLRRHPDLRLSINMSARSIGYGPWVKALERGLAAHSDIGGRLILEISESSAMVMPDVVQSFMVQMQRHGVSFALDDFGAGFTSFRHLKNFYFDILKIDGQFIRQIHADPDNQVLVEALVGLARQFDMYTVAARVENLREVEFLVGAGIDCVQGYYFGAPTLRPRFL